MFMMKNRMFGPYGFMYWLLILCNFLVPQLLWVKKYLGAPAYKRLILSHHKNLNAGEYLIDDRTKNGADRFGGKHIHFGSDEFPDWASVVSYLTS